MCAEKGNKTGEISEKKFFEKWLRKLELFSLEENQGGPHCPLDHLRGGCSEVGIRPFCHVSSEKMRGNGPKPHKKMFRLDTRFFFLLIEGAVKHWNKLSRDMVQ